MKITSEAPKHIDATLKKKGRKREGRKEGRKEGKKERKKPQHFLLGEFEQEQVQI